jgi:SWI/SNF related-matrix-associated actin-dependent regulator of chromatin subfamily C
MIDSFRANTKVYLTATSCRRHLAGDANAVIRVHDFLQTWGLINFNVHPDTRPALLGAPRTANLPLAAASQKGFDSSKISSERANFENLSNSIFYPPKTGPFTCISCSRDCSIQRWTALIQETGDQVHLCLSCHMNDNVPPFKDWKRIGTERDVNWSAQDTLALLKAVNDGVTDWTVIASKFNAKTAQQCIQHFISLPIEEQYLEKFVSSSTGGTSASSVPVDPKAALLADAKGRAFSTAVELSKSAAKGSNSNTVAAFTEAAAKAAAVAEVDSLSICNTLCAILDAQVKKMEIKLNAIDELESSLVKEQAELEKERVSLFQERLALKKKDNSAVINGH